MKYSIKELKEPYLPPYGLYRHEEYKGAPNNAELEFWMRIQELEAALKNRDERIADLTRGVGIALELFK